jgi:hypothetical protein
VGPTEKTLHWDVDKWLARIPAMPARVVTARRCIGAASVSRLGLLSIFFSVTTTDRGMCIRVQGRRAMSAWRTA